MSTNLPLFVIPGLEADIEATVLTHFDQADAFRLGSLAVDEITRRGLSMAVEIMIGEQTVFMAAVGGADPSTASWLRRKAAVVRIDGVSSLLVKLRHEQADTSFADRGLPEDDFAPYGGSIPIRVAGTLVGTITASGAADVVDHDVATTALRRYLETPSSTTTATGSSTAPTHGADM
jgi:uncharacterized protein (UPF0303 family)